MLNITEIKIKKIENGDLLCYASICIEDSLVVDGIKLLQRKDGTRYILMPEKRLKKGNMVRNYAYPIKEETREQMQNVISEEYDNLIEN